MRVRPRRVISAPEPFSVLAYPGSLVYLLGYGWTTASSFLLAIDRVIVSIRPIFHEEIATNGILVFVMVAAFHVSFGIRMIRSSRSFPVTIHRRLLVPSSIQ